MISEIDYVKIKTLIRELYYNLRIITEKIIKRGIQKGCILLFL